MFSLSSGLAILTVGLLLCLHVLKNGFCFGICLLDGYGILVLNDAETVCWYWSVFIKLIIPLICFSTGPKVVTEQDGILTVMDASLVASREYISSSSWRQEKTTSDSTIVSTAVMVLVIAELVAKDGSSRVTVYTVLLLLDWIFHWLST